MFKFFYLNYTKSKPKKSKMVSSKLISFSASLVMVAVLPVARAVRIKHMLEHGDENQNTLSNKFYNSLVVAE